MPKDGLVRLSRRRLSDLKPLPENDLLYKPVDPRDPDIRALADSILDYGLKEPLVISLDDYIISGHRRRMACLLASVEEVPVTVEKCCRGDPKFLQLVREFNRQRVKDLGEIAREEALSIDPNEAYRVLTEHRRAKSKVSVDTIRLVGEKTRKEISPAKMPMLEAVLRVLEDQKEFLPLTDRRIHYALLNDPPLRHARKPDSTYRNDVQSYKDLCDLLTRARLTGEIPFSAIEDPTRPVTVWNVFRHTGPFIASQMGQLLKGYYRDLQQSQPNHIGVVGEKNTVGGIIEPVAMEYCIPVTIGRGYSSLPPRHQMAQRFRKTGKEKLVLLVLSDFDPEGEDIAHSFGRSMRDDFGVSNIVPVKVALTGQQVVSMNLPPQMTAKEGSSRRKKFVDQHGENVYELEAVPPRELQRILREAIDSVLDVEAFNAEVDREKQEAAYLTSLREQIVQAVGNIGA